jgi:hypothetical protein
MGSGLRSRRTLISPILLVLVVVLGRFPGGRYHANLPPSAFHSIPSILNPLTENDDEDEKDWGDDAYIMSTSL